VSSMLNFRPPAESATGITPLPVDIGALPAAPAGPGGEVSYAIAGDGERAAS
jgi:hypothetical protein